MTAEIALLNKSAVALAADSAATVSSRDKQEKVFNSEDKLFELSARQPIGVMIYNSTTFMETPVHILIKKFRSEDRLFETIEDVAVALRQYLKEFGNSLPADVQKRNSTKLIEYAFQVVATRTAKIVSEKFSQAVGPQDRKNFEILAERLRSIDNEEIYQESIDFYISTFKGAGEASFTGPNAIRSIDRMYNRSEDKSSKLDDINVLIQSFLKSSATSDSATGFVIAGFAKNELFPSLRSFEVDGMIGNELRFMNSKAHDITFDGSRAKILPFAQQDMVDRFVSSVDEKSEEDITSFCRKRLASIHNSVLGMLDMADDDKEILSDILSKANDLYIDGLKEDGFAKLKLSAQAEMEGMVEFMPKVDLAQMAESLVELTSIKRRVSRGFETVGGPIDVAVISRSEGFVWIKRKHYFPRELNVRFFERVKRAIGSKEDEHVHHELASPAGEKARRPASSRAGKKRRTKSTDSANDPQPKGDS